MSIGEPAYTRLQVDERRQQLLDAGSRLFAQHAYDEISMRKIAQAAGVSKGLLYHYFPSKIALFRAAAEDKALELQRLIEPDGKGPPLKQLARTLDAYLSWIQLNAQTWQKLMQSASSIPEARSAVERFRGETLERIAGQLTDGQPTPPALRTALKGWLGYIDAAILDWVENHDVPQDEIRDLVVAAFAGALVAAQQVDPSITLSTA